MEKINLGEVVDIISGYAFKASEFKRTGVPVIRISDLDGDRVRISENTARIDEADIDDKYLLKKGDLLIGLSGSIGKIGVFSSDELAYLNQRVGKVITKEGISEDFAVYLINNLVKLMKKDSVGGTVLNISPITIKNYEVYLPNKDEQDFISKKLKTIEKLIQTRQDQIQALDDLVESVYNITLNENNNLVKLKDYVKVNPAKSEVKDLDSNTVISFVPMEDVSENGELSLSKTKTIEEAYKGFTYFKDDDVVVAKITPCFENGKGALMKNLVNGIGFGTTEFHVLRSKDKNIINPVWLNYLTRTRYFRELGEIRMSGSAGQKRIGKDFVENFEFNLPPIEKQNLFAAFVEKIEKQKQILNDSLKELTDLFDSLMQDAFDGSLTK